MYGGPLNHYLLLLKLQNMALKKCIIFVLFFDYLSDRSQAVAVNGCNSISSFPSINTGVLNDQSYTTRSTAVFNLLVITYPRVWGIHTYLCG